MRTLGGLCFVLVLAPGLSAQYRGSVTPNAGGFGSVVFPGGTAAASPNITRYFGSVVHPGGGGPLVTVPGGVVPNYNWSLYGRPAHRNNNNNNNNTAPGAVYAYPVFVGGGYNYSDSYPPDQQGGPQPGGPPQAAPQQPNITVVMPPQQATPIIINVGPGGGQYTPAMEPPPGVYEPQPRPAVEAPAPVEEGPHFLIAFKDHSIYSAVAYWVDGDTLHYFTSGNNHNQVSLSLLDRPLTERLNKESGVEFKLPAAK